MGLLVSCGYVDAYEEAVYDEEPIYCYRSLAGIECFKEPNHLDKRRIVNYYGPHPTHYDEPEPSETPELKAPKEIDFWVKDPEPTRGQIIRMGLQKKKLTKIRGNLVNTLSKFEHLEEGRTAKKIVSFNELRSLLPQNSLLTNGTLIINGNEGSLELK